MRLLKLNQTLRCGSTSILAIISILLFAGILGTALGLIPVYIAAGSKNENFYCSVN